MPASRNPLGLHADAPAYAAYAPEGFEPWPSAEPCAKRPWLFADVAAEDDAPDAKRPRRLLRLPPPSPPKQPRPRRALEEAGGRDAKRPRRLEDGEAAAPRRGGTAKRTSLALSEGEAADPRAARETRRREPEAGKRPPTPRAGAEEPGPAAQPEPCTELVPHHAMNVFESIRQAFASQDFESLRPIPLYRPMPPGGLGGFASQLATREQRAQRLVFFGEAGRGEPLQLEEEDSGDDEPELPGLVVYREGPPFAERRQPRALTEEDARMTPIVTELDARMTPIVTELEPDDAAPMDV